MRPLHIRNLGSMPYADAWALQNQLAQARARDEIPDQLLLVEHPHTYTFGAQVHDEHLLLSPTQLAQRGIAVVRSDRGGDITYHGPGQLVAYPILKLSEGRGEVRADVLAYVRNLETTIIHTLADYAVSAFPIAGLTGVWVHMQGDPHKIAAIGVKVSAHSVTKHGTAINLNTDLSYFDGIVPCGIRDKGVTSLAQLRHHPIDEATFAKTFTQHFLDTFEYSP
jgi:lipoyl(octanoyl) transferase